jgi:amidohydrolase
MKHLLLFPLCFGLAVAALAQRPTNLALQVEQRAKEIEPKLLEWRRDLHQYPELSNREFKTAAKVAAHLKNLGLEVQEKVAHTGVVAVLRGGKPGPVVALRADMDALPVPERVDVPFASKQRTQYNGQDVGVMHACGHDTHVAILMAVAEILTAMKADVPGTVKFIFQPAEEGAPEGEEGGAELMVKEGVLNNPKVEAIFGLHINAQTEVGKLRYKPESMMAAVDMFKVKVRGKQTHGSQPWSGVDPVVTASQIVLGLQTIISRSVNLTDDAAVVSVGAFHGGVRSNIIPEEVELEGTIRTFNDQARAQVHDLINRIATNIAESAGAKAEVKIRTGYPVTYNDPVLTALMLPTLQASAGKENVVLMRPTTGAEDFSFFARQVPGLFFNLGGMPKGKKAAEAAPHHTPDFYIDESGLVLGVKTMCNLVFDYAGAKKK